MTKQEQIAEIAKIIYEMYNVYTTQADDIAEGLYNIGYRKITEDSIVISMEEYERLKQYEEKGESGALFTQKEWLDLCEEEHKRNTEHLSKINKWLENYLKNKELQPLWENGLEVWDEKKIKEDKK